MAGEMTAGRFDRTDWELLLRQYEAGASRADIVAQTGLSESWVRKKLWMLSKDDASTRARHYLDALHRELIRAETELLKGSVESAVKQMRALNMLMKLEKELKRAAEPESTPVAEAGDIVDVRAELERRFDRLRAARDATRLSGLHDEDAGNIPHT